MKRLRLTLMIGCLVVTACKPAPKEEPPKSAAGQVPDAAAKTYAPATPPTQKQVLRALLQIQDVGLANIPSCAGVGTEQTDVNIGDYISGFLAEQGSSKGGNSIDVSTKEEQEANQERAWRSQVMIRHLDGDDRWGWGVSFLMRATDHTVVKESVQCVGAG
jgi:hypothetical protein